MGRGQSLLALTVIKNALHECRHQGCNVKLNLSQIKNHEELCIWRIIPCPGSRLCQADIPLCNVENHAQSCPGCMWRGSEEGEGLWLINRIKVEDFGKEWSWQTRVFELKEGGRQFFVKSWKKEGIYKVDALMNGSQEDCEGFIVEASMVIPGTTKPVFKSSFQPRPLTDQNESIFCLSVPKECLDKVWKYEDGIYTFECCVNIVKLD